MNGVGDGWRVRVRVKDNVRVRVRVRVLFRFCFHSLCASMQELAGQSTKHTDGELWNDHSWWLSVSTNTCLNA